MWYFIFNLIDAKLTIFKSETKNRNKKPQKQYDRQRAETGSILIEQLTITDIFSILTTEIFFEACFSDFSPFLFTIFEYAHH